MHHRIERINAGHCEKLHGFPFFFGQRYDARKNFPLVVGENLVLAQQVFSGPRGGNAADRHDDNVLLADVRLLKHVLKMLHPVIVANRHKHAARPYMDRIGRDFRTHVEIELLEAFGFGFRFVEAAFRNRKNDEQNCSERHSGNRRDSLGEQIGYCHEEQHHRGEDQSQGNLATRNPDVPRGLIFLIVPLVSKHQYTQRLQEKTPHDSERVSFAKQIGLASAQDHSN